MKKQLRNIFLSCMLGLFNQVIIPNQPQQQPQGFPSVSEVFGNRSSEDIINEVQEAQKFFDSLSPEEMLEVEKMVEETLKHMSPQDLEDIQNIATMVEPHLDIPKQETQESTSVDIKATETKEKTSIDEIDVDTNNIIQLVTDINKQVNEVLQKAESSKELSEEITHKWASKISVDSMVRQILALKEDRLAKKLSKKDSKEDEDLINVLQKFHQDLSVKNKNFKVEDSFGVQESRAVEQKQLASLQDVLSMFDTHLDKVAPPMEKFLTKHDPEKLELAKAAEERAKKAKAHAQDASVRRGSAQAQAVTGSSRSQQPQSYPSGRSTGSQGPSSYPGFDQPVDKLTPKDQSSSDFNKQSGSKTPSNKPATDSSSAKTEFTPFQQITTSLEDHVHMFDQDHQEAFEQFLKQDVSGYPNPEKADKVPSNPAERDEWLNNEFSNYERSVKKNITKFSREFENINKSLTDNLSNISKISSDKELAQLADDKNLKKIKARVASYKKAFTPAKEEIESRYAQNVSIESDPLKGPMTLTEYKQRHRDLMMHLESSLEAPLIDAEHTISQVEKRIKRRKTKSSAQDKQFI